MENFILGTAGHIDHGKSALVKALSGIETDRLAEEKERGISIVLGYANIILPSGISAGIIDVPGHSKFIKTMVSGSTGMNGVLLVVAADDGIMAQTEEHLLILKLLGINLIIPVLTKTDLADEAALSAKEKEFKDFLVSYGFNDASENISRVSVKNNEGIEKLKMRIESEIMRSIRSGNISGAASGYEATKVFLPIDRIISLKGFGTIIAGTLKYGSFSVNDEIQVMPEGYLSKIKNIESHNKNIETALRNMRIAVNVPSLEKEKVRRGDVLSLPDSLASSDSILVLLRFHSAGQKELKNHFTVSLMTGGTNVKAKVIVLNEKKKILPGESSFALLKLADKISTMYMERFIIRDIGAAKTIGGGIVLDACFKEELNNSSPDRLNIYGRLVNGTREDVVAGFTGIAGSIRLDGLYRKLNMKYRDFVSAVDDARRNMKVLVDPKGKLAVSAEVFVAKKAYVLKIINDYAGTGANILKDGMGKQELLYKVNCDEELFGMIIEELSASGLILVRDGRVSLKKAEDNSGNVSQNNFQLPPEYAEMAGNLKNFLNSSGNSVPSPDEIEKKLRINRKPLNNLLAFLVKDGSLIKIKSDIYYLKEQFDEILAGLDMFFEKNEKLEPSNIKEIAGVSRKYAIPILEYLDRIGYTLKTGNYRVKSKL